MIIKQPKPQTTDPPIFEPVTLAEAKYQVQVASGVSRHDDRLNKLITSAREFIEINSAYQIASRGLVWALDAWPASSEPIRLPTRYVTTANKIDYFDSDGSLVSILEADLNLDVSGVWPAIWLADQSAGWPTAKLGQGRHISVSYTAGWLLADDVPSWIKETCLAWLEAVWSRADEGEGMRFASKLLKARVASYLSWPNELTA